MEDENGRGRWRKGRCRATRWYKMRGKEGISWKEKEKGGRKRNGESKRKRRG